EMVRFCITAAVSPMSLNKLIKPLKAVIMAMRPKSRGESSRARTAVNTVWATSLTTWPAMTTVPPRTVWLLRCPVCGVAETGEPPWRGGLPGGRAEATELSMNATEREYHKIDLNSNGRRQNGQP